MAETFINLALIYIVIIVSCFGYYYIAKAVASNKQRKEKEKAISQSFIADKITAHQNSITPVSTITNKEVKEEVLFIKEIAEPDIKTQHSPAAIAQINKRESAIINQSNEVSPLIGDNVTKTTVHQNNIAPVSITMEQEINEAIKPIEKNAEPDIKIQHLPDSVVPLNEKDTSPLNQPGEVYKPQLNLFKQNTQAGKGYNAGLIKTIYYFGCEKGYSITNPTIEIIFKTRFSDISGGISGAGIITPNYLAKHTFDNNTRFVITTDLLQPWTYIFIQTISNRELQIEDLKIFP